MAFEIPDACTLPTAERLIRLREFDELLADSVRRAGRDSPTHLTLHLRGDENLEALTRDLAAREAQCCSFFEFNVAVEGDEVELGIGVPPQYSSVLDSLQERSGALK
jgi:hypothetical protein